MNTQPILETIKNNIIGKDASIKTPFGERLMTYADYTASGRALSIVEDYLNHCMETYGNTHTEDDITGAESTFRLHQAEKIIKNQVNAGSDYVIIETGAGATGAIHYLQQLLGIYIPPAGKEMRRTILTDCFGSDWYEEYSACLMNNRPVVFVGPYEHHSNEISWRECFAEVVEISLDADGYFDLHDLEEKLSRKEYDGRMKIGSFSAASNVTGLKSPVYDIAALLHRYDALAFFDYAAAAPYVDINVNRNKESFFDGIFFSPHKFLGGPGGSGILIIHKRIYKASLPPTIAGGGTVDYVNAYVQEYCRDIETREKAGTPGILQIYKAALAMDLKGKIGIDLIEEREKNLLRTVLDNLADCPNIQLVAPMDEEHNLPILSFNVRCGSSWIHPRFAVKLLNDLFGIQARAGCSCAGPYGHHLLHIDGDISEHYHDAIRKGNMGLKPGWARVSFHYLMSENEAVFICKAIRFLGEYAKYFLPLYSFDIHSGAWQHRTYTAPATGFGIDEALESAGEAAHEIPEQHRKDIRSLGEEYLEHAERLAKELRETYRHCTFKTTQADLISFLYVETYGEQ